MDKKKVSITILATSDIHGNVLPIQYGDNREVHHGLAKVSTIIKAERKTSEHVILIDNGDLIQGTPLTFNYVHNKNNNENPMIKILNHLRYDAAVIGNHEFNYGLNVLHEAVGNSCFPWLSANIIDAEKNTPYFGQPYIIKMIEDVKLAILGVTTHFIPSWEEPSHIAGLKFIDTLNATKQWVSEIIAKENPDILIVSYHGGFERDLISGELTEEPTGENQGFQICKEVEGIHVLFTGHQHREISGMIDNTTVIQPGMNGANVGKVEITLTQDPGENHIDDISSEIISCESVLADNEIVELISEYERETQDWLDNFIGTVEGDMKIEDPLSVRLKDHPYIEFINKMQMEISGAEISCTSLFNNASIGFKEKITMRDVVSNYIYPNTLKVLKLKGEDIKKALELSATYFIVNNSKEIEVNPKFITPKPQHYNYDMWEGINYILDISKPIGSRVTKLEQNGEPLGMNFEYHVVMNNYRASGGGQYTMFKEREVVKEINQDVSELLASYIIERGIIKASLNHNWKVIS